jgi:hypothetical protein
MKRSYQIATAVLLVTILGTFSTAQASHSSYDPAHSVPSKKPRDSFLDFTLKRINSATNYGQCLSESRAMLLEETITNAYFWSNIVALSVLGCFFIVIVYQHRVQTKREWATAEIVTELERSLTRSRAQVVEATKKNRELTDAVAALRESALRAVSLPSESAERSGPSATKSRTISAQPVPPTMPAANSVKPTNGSNTRSAAAKEPVDQMRLFTPDADFVMKLNSLEQQLAQSREDNKQLRRRITDGDRRLELEQERNRQLKGA